MNSTESTNRGYRTNRAAQIRMEEIKRKLLDQPKQARTARLSSMGSKPMSRYGNYRRTRERRLDGIDSSEDMNWMVRAQEVLKNRGSPICSEKRAYDQAEELARLQRAVHSKRILKDKLVRISSEIAALTGSVLKEEMISSSSSTIGEEK